MHYIFCGKRYARERHRHLHHDLVRLTNNPYFEAVSLILDAAAVEDPARRLPTMSDLESRVREAKEHVMEERPIPGKYDTYRCVFCCSASYIEVARSLSTRAQNLGYGGEGTIGEEQLVFLECPRCGNVQRFKLKHGGATWFTGK